MILVGKDDGAKLRAESAMDLEPIFLLIDSMPMRRLEMQWRLDCGFGTKGHRALHELVVQKK